MKKHFPLLKYKKLKSRLVDRKLKILKNFQKTDRIEDIKTCDKVIIYSKFCFIIRANYPSIANKIVIWAENKQSFIQKMIA